MRKILATATGGILALCAAYGPYTYALNPTIVEARLIEPELVAIVPPPPAIQAVDPEAHNLVAGGRL